MSNFDFQSADFDGTKHTRYQFQKKNFPPDFKSWQPTTPFSVTFHRRLLNQACAQHNPQGDVGVEGVGVLMPRTTEMIFNPKISRIPGIFSPSKNQASFVFLLHFALCWNISRLRGNNSEKYFWLVKIELQRACCVLTRTAGYICRWISNKQHWQVITGLNPTWEPQQRGIGDLIRVLYIRPKKEVFL